MNYFWWSGRKTERRAKRQDSWAFRESQNFEKIGGHYEKEVIYPKNNYQGPRETQKCSWLALEKSQWKISPPFLRWWKGSEVKSLEASLRPRPTEASAIHERRSGLANVTYLFVGGPASWYVLSFEASKCTRMWNFHFRASSCPSTPDLWIKPGRGNCPHHKARLVTTAGGFHLIVPPQQPVSMGWKQQETPDDVSLCRQRATLITSEAHFTFLLSRRIFLNHASLVVCLNKKSLYTPE